MLVVKHSAFYTYPMIDRYKNDDAFRATEELLLVPVPIKETDDLGGFAGQVMERFGLAEAKLRMRGGLDTSEILIIGHLGQEKRTWLPAYSLALCGIHHREADGWTRSPEYLKESLDRIKVATELGVRARVATAGIPGTGFSGLRGNASPEAIREVLGVHELGFTVYQDGLSGDRAKLLHADPSLDDELIKV